MWPKKKKIPSIRDNTFCQTETVKVRTSWETVSSGVCEQSIRYKSMSSEVRTQTDDRLVPDDSPRLCHLGHFPRQQWATEGSEQEFNTNHTVNVNRSGTGLKRIGSAYEHICHWRVLQESRFHRLTNIYWSLPSCATELDDSSKNGGGRSWWMLRKN